jgi:hypothetical protein
VSLVQEPGAGVAFGGDGAWPKLLAERLDLDQELNARACCISRLSWLFFTPGGALLPDQAGASLRVFADGVSRGDAAAAVTHRNAVATRPSS